MKQVLLHLQPSPKSPNQATEPSTLIKSNAPSPHTILPFQQQDQQPAAPPPAPTAQSTSVPSPKQTAPSAPVLTVGPTEPLTI